MEAPKFKVGDKVWWARHQNEEGIIADGPFAPGVRHWNQELGRGWPDEYSYVIMAFASGKSGLVGESALALMEQWVACPGEHRPQPFAEVPFGRPHGWQRRVS